METPKLHGHDSCCLSVTFDQVTAPEISFGFTHPASQDHDSPLEHVITSDVHKEAADREYRVRKEAADREYRVHKEAADNEYRVHKEAADRE